MRFKVFCLLMFSAVLSACNSSTTKKEEPSAYTSREIGWTIDIPKGYKLTNQAKLDADDQKGKEAIGKVYDGEIKTDSLTHLVSFSRNQFNSFNSTIEAYQEKVSGDYDANNELIKKLLFDTYHKQGIKLDTSSKKIDISGQQFNAFYIKVFGPNGAVILNQIMFNKMIKGYDFGANINYNSEEDKKLLLDAFMNSKFK